MTHKNNRPLPGDILVFLTGQDEIESMAKVLMENAKSQPKGSPKLLVCTLYGALAAEQQLEVFNSAPAGYRKVILSTNIAETSLTINGVVYVIDTGMVKQKAFNPRTQLDTLRVRPISRAQANQRTGRAGREAAGWCFRYLPPPFFLFCFLFFLLKNTEDAPSPSLTRTMEGEGRITPSVPSRDSALLSNAC